MSHLKKSAQEWDIIFYRFAKNRQTIFKAGEHPKDQRERNIMKSIINCDCHKPGIRESQGHFKRMFDGKLVKCTCRYHVPTITASAPSMYQVLDEALANKPNINLLVEQNAASDAISNAGSSSPTEIPKAQILQRTCNSSNCIFFFNHKYFVCFKFERKMKHLKYLLFKRGQTLS